MRGHLNSLTRQIAKLRVAAPPGTGADWLLLWRLDDTIKGVQALFPRGAPRSAGTLLVLLHEARRLGIADRPDVKAAIDALTALTVPPPAALGWAQRVQLEDAQRAAGSTLAGLVLKAQGAPDGPMGPHPPGGRPDPQPVAAWLAEAVRQSQEPPRSPPTPSTPPAPPSPLDPPAPSLRVVPSSPPQ